MADTTTDYLVVGAGASGMAFTDALIDAADVDVVLVDRQHTAGGHWNHAYPFVRLHQPSAYYGVDSVPLGRDRIDTTGPNAGGYERADSVEIRDYYRRVLTERLVGSGRVRFFGLSDYRWDPSNGHTIVSRLTGDQTHVRVRRKLVDATYLEGEIPSRHALPFETGEDVQVVPPNGLVDRGPWDGAVDGYTVVGSGKTGMDVCNWLLECGVPAEAIRWVRPRDSWSYNRELVQPRDLVASVVEGVAIEMEAAAEAADVPELFARLEAGGRLLRVDPEVEPTMFRAATLSRSEIDSLRGIDDVVRLGRLRRVERDALVLEHGTVKARPGHLYVDCTASGLSARPARAIFEPDRITVQTVRIGLTPFNAALLGHVEATRDDDADKNRLCPPNLYPSRATDWLSTTYVSTAAERMWGDDPDLSAWLEASRLNLASGIGAHLAEPRMQDAITRLLTHRDRGLDNLRRMVSGARSSAG